MKRQLSKLINITKLLKSKLILLAFALLGFASGQNFYYDDFDTYDEKVSTDFGSIIKEDVIEKSDSILNRLLEVFQLSTKSWYGTGTSKALLYIQMIANMMLSFVGLIALILVVYAFYLMFFTTHEDGAQKARRILRGVAIAVAIVGLSWLIVSLFFYVQTTIAS